MQEAEYRKLAAVEDRMWYFSALHALIETELSARLGLNVLDAGCGTGGLLGRLHREHPQWQLTGVDLSPLACELARERLGSVVDILESSITSLPFPAAHFDAIISADVLYHVPDDNAALRELRRVLRPGGVLIVNVPAHPWLWSYHDEAVGGLRRYRRIGLRRQLSDAGFSSVRLTHWNGLLLPLIAARRKLLPPPSTGSDVQEYSLPLEWLGRGATRLERAWLRIAPLPFGSSLFGVASQGYSQCWSTR